MLAELACASRYLPTFSRDPHVPFLPVEYTVIEKAEKHTVQKYAKQAKATGISALTIPNYAPGTVRQSNDKHKGYIRDSREQHDRNLLPSRIVNYASITSGFHTHNHKPENLGGLTCANTDSLRGFTNLHPPWLLIAVSICFRTTSNVDPPISPILETGLSARQLPMCSHGMSCTSR